MPTALLARFIIMVLNEMTHQAADDALPTQYRGRKTLDGQPWRVTMGGAGIKDGRRLF